MYFTLTFKQNTVRIRGWLIGNENTILKFVSLSVNFFENAESRLEVFNLKKEDWGTTLSKTNIRIT